MMRGMKYMLLILAGLLATPVYASSSHSYTCTDLSFTGGATPPTCIGSTLTFDPLTNGYVADVSGGGGGNHSFPLTTAGTWYFTANVASAVGQIGINVYGDNFNGTEVDFSGSVTDLPFTAPAGNTGAGLWITNTGTGGEGVLTDICVSDTVGVCPPAGGGGGGGFVATSTWTLPSFATILGSTTEAANIAIGDFLTPFYIIFAILAGGLFAVMIRKWIWKSGRKVWGR